MFIAFTEELRAAGIPASLKEHLLLIEAMRTDVIGRSVEEFYFLSRTIFVKDESLLDRFDRVFGQVFRGLEGVTESETFDLPEEWLRKLAELHLSSEEMEAVQSLGGWEALMQALKERLAEQEGRHQGGSKWVGTAGTSPFGAYGYNPEGVRIGQEWSRHRRAVKVWDRREFENLDSSVELGTRNIQLALRRLRRFAREGAADELDLDATISGTARRGWLDVVMRPERHNAAKLLLLLDVGGSMDPYVRTCEELFSAARAEFKHLEFFYFHNCPYESLWKDNRRRTVERTPTFDVLHTFGHDYKLVLVGDASMSPYELVMPGGSVEHMNEEPGLLWLKRLTDTYFNTVWLNPVEKEHWAYTPSIGQVADALGGRMYPLTLEGLDEAMRELSRRH